MGYFLEKLAAEAEDSQRTLGSTARGAGIGAGIGAGAAGAGLGAAYGAGKLHKYFMSDRPQRLIDPAKADEAYEKLLAAVENPDTSRKAINALQGEYEKLNGKFVDPAKYKKFFSKLKGVGKVALPATAAAGLIAGGYGLGKN